MFAGKLGETISILQRTIAHDLYNEPIETWATKFEIPCMAVTDGGREFYAAQKLNAETSVVFRARHTRRVLVTNRIRWAGRVFEILALNDVGAAHEELRISAKEVI